MIDQFVEDQRERLVHVIDPSIRGGREFVEARVHVPGDLVREMAPDAARSVARTIVEAADVADELNVRARPHAEAFIREVGREASA